ncbi:MAG TPA: hypothetical protein VFP60_12110 [Pseudolabrys sp.]|nr:hypothetical protein [Pseudolabrys sp.]
MSLHPARGILGPLFALTVILLSALAWAQEAGPDSKPPQNEGFFASVSRWFSEQSANFGSSLKDARKKMETFGEEAGTAAKSTVEGAKDAAGAVARIPVARAVKGHEKCQTAPNGAPDCIVAANAICKANGFESGRSLDMTTAEVCPAKVWMAGRSSGPECRTETFVSRALCQ